MKAARFLLILSILACALGLPVFGQEAIAPANASAQQSTAPDNSKPSPNQNQLPPITVTSGLVHLVATVTDKRRSFVTDLEQGDFKVLENGVPQEIRFFGR